MYQVGQLIAMLLRGDVKSPMRSKDVHTLPCFQASPGPTTDVLVRGRPNAQQVAGKAGGLKLMEIRRLAAKGHQVTIVGEDQFWRLVRSV